MFIGAWLRGEEPVSVLCGRYAISRKTGYKWMERYREAGVAGLGERSSARHAQPTQIDAETAELVRALRQQRPSWGPKKLLVRLRQEHSDRTWPAASTLGDLLRREGLSQPRRRKPKSPSSGVALTEPTAPNESWAADFKGWFRTGDGVRCEPFTMSDGYSRYLLVTQAVARVTMADVQPIMIRAFQEHGLPRALRTDNGPPFARRDGLGGLTQLSVWLLTLDIWPDRIAPRRPDQNGRHERMHRVLQEDTAIPPAATLAGQQARLDAWRVDYNTCRPHEALGQRCPASLYCGSPRSYPTSIRSWDYPADHHVRSVLGDGYIRWQDGTVYLSGALRGQTVAVARRDDGDWAIRFRGFDLAVLLEAGNTVKRCGLARTPLYFVT
jgi:transposase InsO family protein